jgi:hypothetical protein
MGRRNARRKPPPTFYRGHTMSAAMPCKAHPAFYRGSTDTRRNVIKLSPPTFYRGSSDGRRSAICCPPSREGSWKARRNANPPHALPNQFNGVMVKTQKCQDIVAPRERSTSSRRNAEKEASSPNQFTGGHTVGANCHVLLAPANHRGH